MTTTTADEQRSAGKKSKTSPEIITCDNIQAIEVGLDDEELVDKSDLELAKPSTSLTSEPPIRLVMKLPKTTATAATEDPPALVKPLKLKLKLAPNPETGSTEPQIIQVEKSPSTSKAPKSSKTSSHHRNEDDELIKDLKNAYVDDDFGKSNAASSSSLLALQAHVLCCPTFQSIQV